MRSPTRWLQLIAGWVMTFMLPPMLLMSSVFLLLNPIFLNLEYRRPGFPPDSYGFSLEDRLKFSKISVAFLVNSKSIDFLGDQRMADGTSLYNERELSHMVDVKAVVQTAIHWWLVGLILLVSFLIWTRRNQGSAEFWLALSRGGYLTTALIISMLVAVILNFDALFTWFHNLFFVSGTWTFYYSDSLIRLFPLPFWQDCFIIVGTVSVLAGAALGFFSHRHGPKKM